MRSKTLVLAALTAMAAGSLMASQAAAPKKAATAAKANLVGAGELKWVDVPNTPAKMATVKGDSAKGAHASFVKLPVDSPRRCTSTPRTTTSRSYPAPRS